jgi:hypothetical protein
VFFLVVEAIGCIVMAFEERDRVIENVTLFCRGIVVVVVQVRRHVAFVIR